MLCNRVQRIRAADSRLSSVRILCCGVKTLGKVFHSALHHTAGYSVATKSEKNRAMFKKIATESDRGFSQILMRLTQILNWTHISQTNGTVKKLLLY